MDQSFIQLNAGGHGGARPPQPPSGPGGRPAGPGQFPPAPPRGILPVDLRGGPPIQISDVSQDLLSEADMADQLTEYVIYRFEKMPKREYDDDSHCRRPTWDKAIRSQDRSMSQKETARRIRYLDRHSPPLIVKRNSLSPPLQRHIDKAQEQLTSHDPDLGNFQWVLAQIEHQLKPIELCPVTVVKKCTAPRKHCSWSRRRPKSSGHRSSKKKEAYERVSFTTYFKRIPRPEAPVLALWANRRGIRQNSGQQPPPNQQSAPPPPPPAGGPSQGGRPKGPPGPRPGGPAPAGPGGLGDHGGRRGQGGQGGREGQIEHRGRGDQANHGGHGDHGGEKNKTDKHARVVRVLTDSESESDSIFSSFDESTGTSPTSQSSGSPGRHHHGRRGRSRSTHRMHHKAARSPSRWRRHRAASRSRARHHHIRHDRPIPIPVPMPLPVPPPPPPMLSDSDLDRAYLAGRHDEKIDGRRPRVAQPRAPLPPPRFTRAHRIPIDPADLRYPRGLAGDDSSGVSAGDMARFAFLSLDDSDGYGYDYDDYDAELRRRRRRRHGEYEYHARHGSSIMSEDPFAGSSTASGSSSSVFAREARRPRGGGHGRRY